jgi:glycosyltransferase involved in cell wall biosynthesis
MTFSLQSSLVRVLHTITDLNIGGAETMLCRLLAAGQRTRFEPVVVSLMAPGALASQLEALSVSIRTLGMPRQMPSLAAVVRLVRSARAIRPDLLQGWMYHGNLAATVSGWALGRPLPVLWNIRHSVHDLAREKPLTRSIIRLGAALSALPRAIIYNSRVSAGQHEALGYAADKTVVIPNGFDCERFKPSADAKARLCQELEIDPATTIVGMIGRDHPMKDPANLITAIGLLEREAPAVHLAIVGRGLDGGNEALLRAIACNGMAGRVSLLGERHDVPCIVGGFDIAVVPSAWGEGFPNVLGEAMASGVPCVATDIGDCAWIVGDAGLIVPPADSRALAEALRRLIELGPDGRRRLGQAGRARTLEHFSIREIVRRYEELYEDVMADSQTSGTGQGGRNVRAERPV